VYLAYLDDSGSDAKSPTALVGSIIIPDDVFSHLENLIGMVVESLIPEHKQAAFTEFHATELYWGHGVFEGIAAEQRHEAMRHLLSIVSTFRLPFIYSAVNKKQLASSPAGSTQPVDMAFRMCALGIHDWLAQPERKKRQIGPLAQGQSLDPLCLFVFDDTADGQLKKLLKQGFNHLRARQRPPWPTWNRLELVHDDMYFGSSTDSIGIQLADLCCFFMMRFLKDGSDQEFFDLFAHQAKCAQPTPEWGTFREYLVIHRRD